MRRSAVAALMVVLLAGTALAVPKLINYQGYLTDNGGNALNGDYDMTFKVFNGVTEHWTEDQVDITVTDGVFNVLLGAVTPIDWVPGADCSLEVTVEGEAIVPKTPLASVPYAYNGVPVGGIILWSGAIVDIPDGWALCDGNNGTPNLADRFVVGAGNLYSVGDNGGSASVTLTVANLPGHTHSFSASTSTIGNHTHSCGTAGNHRHSLSGGSTNSDSHSHTYFRPTSTYRVSYGGSTNVFRSSGSNYYTSTDTHSHSLSGYTQYDGNHSHSIGSAGGHSHTVSGTTGSTGSGTPFGNLPPYYALAFIMKQ